MNKSFLVVWLLFGQWLSPTVVAQGQPTGRADGNPFALPSPFNFPTSGLLKTPVRVNQAAVQQLCYDNGWERRRRGDDVGAEAEFSRVIQLHPTYGPAYVARAGARRRQSNFTGAFADYARATEVDPDNPYLYRASAVTQMLVRRWTEAAADLQVSCVKSGHDNGYAAVLLWIARMHLHETDSARDGLASFIAKSSEFDRPGDWVQEIERFLMDRETEADLMNAAARKAASSEADRRLWFAGTPPTESLNAKSETATGPLCEAWYYSGMKRLFAGDKEGAAEHFRQCLATKRLTFIEYELAEAELHELEK